MTPFGKGAQDFPGEGGVTVAKGISGKAHTSKVADGYTQAGQYDEAIRAWFPRPCAAMEANGRQREGCKKAALMRDAYAVMCGLRDLRDWFNDQSFCIGIFGCVYLMQS